MSDTTETETETNTDTTDEPNKAELHDRVQQLESTVEKLMPSRRDALKLGAAGIAGAAGLGAASQPADASTGSAGQIGDPNNRPDLFADEIDANQLTGVSTGGDRQGCRVFLSSQQNISGNSLAQIQFDSEVFDSDNNFDTATHEWTCPKTGLYLVNLQVEFRGGGDGQLREIRIGSGANNSPNGEGTQREEQDSSTFVGLHTSTINKYQQGDRIAAYAQNRNTSDRLGAGNLFDETFMEVAFLGGL